MRSISEVVQYDTASGPAIRFKFHDKITALDRLCKVLGLYHDHKSIAVEHSFVLRAPDVAETTDKWLSSERAKMIEHNDSEKVP